MKIKEKIAQNPKLSEACAKMWKASPTICVVGGVVLGAGSLYLAWRAGRKTEEVYADVNNDILLVKDTKPDLSPSIEENEALMKEYRKNLTKAYTKAGYKLGKLYAPAVLCEVASVLLIAKGYGTLNNRNTAAIAACAVAENGLARYRNKVIEKYGEEVDHDLYYGYSTKEEAEPVLDKDGNPKLDKEGNPRVKKVVTKVQDDAPDEFSSYARKFDRHSKQFMCYEDTTIPDTSYNIAFLKKQEVYFNNLIRYKPTHIIFLNEVYEALGLQPTQAGQIVGWYYNKENPIGDNYIRFVPDDIYDAISNGEEVDEIWLDFNVDGNVYKYL